ncbi:unnamed protein product [Arctia plantaginis]|uniref:Uncharacterized protein n=1 Tax=Arctia plantaginis TaxID=874455 RepID=A0A8S1AUN0_ARCPL|nr:unnamed protein product [Arctia plantaginis]
MSLSDDLFNAYNLQKGKTVKNHIDSDQSTAYEVFRNKTTAVEVIVKEVPNNKQKIGIPLHQDIAGRHAPENFESLKQELIKTNNILEKSRISFQICMREMKKQLDSANQMEMDIQTKYLNLKLENEKLKTLLMSKTNLVKKLSKELSILKRIIKSVIKNMINIPKADNNNVSCTSDPDYDDFEKNLKGDLKFTKFDQSVTFDSSAPKELNNTFDKRLFE